MEAAGPSDLPFVALPDSEAIEYDVDAEQAVILGDSEPKGTSAVSDAIKNLVNSIVGAGIVGLPYVFAAAGFVTGLILTAMAWFLVEYSLRLLVRTGMRYGARNYEDLMGLAFGPVGVTLVSLALFVFEFGAMCTYFIILGDSSEMVAVSLFKLDPESPLVTSWTLRRLCIIGFGCCFSLPLCCFRDISSLERSSGLSVGAVIVIALLVVGKFVQLAVEPTFEIQPRLTVVGPAPFKSFSIICFAFVCHDTAYLIFNTLREPTCEAWDATARVGLMAAVSICLLLSVPGYLTFGADTKSNILTNYPVDDPLVIACRCIYIVVMTLVYPMSFFVCRHIVNAVLWRGDSHQAIQVVSSTRFYGLTAVIFVCTVGITLVVRDLGVVMSLTGSLGAVNLAFVFPPACALKLAHGSWQRAFASPKSVIEAKIKLKQVVCPVFVMIFGVCAMFSSVYETVFVAE